MKKLIKNKEMLGGSIFFIGSLYILYEITQFPTTAERYRSLGPEVFPYFIAGMLCVLSLILFFQGTQKARAPILSTALFCKEFLRVYLIIALLIVYMIFVEKIGFVLWGVAFMALVQFFLGERRLGVIVLLAVIVVGVVYTVFALLLRVPLPQGSLLG